MKVPAEKLAEISALHHGGLYLQAHNLALTLGPYRNWEGTEARIMAGRLAGNLGSASLRHALIQRAWRADPSNPWAIYYVATVHQDRRGLLETWEWTSRHPDLPEAPPDLRGDWLALRASLAAGFRDFDTADRLMRSAMDLAPDRSWLFVQRARVLSLQDSYEEALASAKRAVELRPGYGPAIQATAHILELLGRDSEALELLRSVTATVESGLMHSQLATLEMELGLHESARVNLERLAALTPLKDKFLSQWIHARLADVAHVLGDEAAALEHAKAADTPEYQRFIDRAGQAGGFGRRVLLPVPFVRQHYFTCAPATLTALSRFWGKPAEHLEVAERICYDGTPAHSERTWAEEAGWTVREFTVTWNVATRLIDLKIPFTLSLSGPRYGHLQAVSGYDQARLTLLVRDPTERRILEYDAELFLKEMRSTGPRGMVMVPPERSADLDGIELPDVDMYSRLHAMLKALDARDRARAQGVMDELIAAFPNHRITSWARRALASYDGDRVRHLEAIDELLSKYPDDVPLLVDRLASLKLLARQDELLDILRRRAAAERAHPCFLQALAEELAVDAREHPAAERLLRRVLRHMPDESSAYASLSNILWSRGDREQSVELLRFASGLRDKDEGLASSYFLACVAMGRQDAALETLRSRHARFGRKSSWPARTLIWALDQLDRAQDGRSVLTEALKAHPQDGDLRLTAAEAAATRGDFAEAEEYLEEAAAGSRPIALLRSRAFIAAVRGDPPASLELWLRVVEADPLDMDAHASVVRLMTETGNRTAAESHLRAAVERFPYHLGLHQLWFQWLQREEPAGSEVERALRRMLEFTPRNAWALRELALVLARQGRIDEGLAASDEAIRLEPHSAWSHSTRARVCRLAGQVANQGAAARDSLRKSVDVLAALDDLIEACRTLPERREALAFVRSELERQAQPGEAVRAYRETASTILERDELTGHLRTLQSARPDLWVAWEALILQVAEGGDHGEASALAQKAIDRFPLVPRIWLAQGRAARLAGSLEVENAALQRALEISPTSGEAALELAACLRRSGETERELNVLQVAATRSPLDAHIHESLARCLWHLGQRESALLKAAHAARLRPGFEPAWQDLLEWGAILNRNDEALKVARGLTETRSTDASVWLALAKIPRPPADLPDRLAALDKALTLEPRQVDALDLKAILLADAGRFDEAASSCEWKGADGRVPISFRGRAVWLEARRGRVAEAIQRMRSLLEEDPGYSWGWIQLLEWSRASDPRLALTAAEQVVRLEPQSLLGLAYLAEAKVAVKDYEGAKWKLRAALKLDPDFGLAAVRLVDLHVNDKEYDRAEAVIDSLRGGRWEHVRLERRIRLEVHRGQRKKAAEFLESLARIPEGADQSLAAAVESMLDVGASREAADALERALGREGVVPEAGFQWMRCVARQARWKDARRGLRKILPNRPAWERAASVYLELLADSGAYFAIRWFIFMNRTRIRRATTTWGSAGYALLTRVGARSARRWLSDWESRPDVAPWMMLNISAAFRIEGKDAEANRVSRAALYRSPDSTTEHHRLWIAFDEAVDGSAEAAAGAFETLDGDAQLPFWRFLRGAGKAVICSRIGKGSKSDRFRAARGELAGALAEMRGSNYGGEFRRSFLRCVRTIARERGGIVGFSWWLWCQVQRF